MKILKVILQLHSEQFISYTSLLFVEICQNSTLFQNKFYDV